MKKKLNRSDIRIQLRIVQQTHLDPISVCWASILPRLLHQLNHSKRIHNTEQEMERVLQQRLRRSTADPPCFDHGIDAAEAVT